MQKLKINLIIQSFGRQSEYNRALLLIYSFLLKTNLEEAQYEIHLFTDNKGVFEIPSSLCTIVFHDLTPQRIKEFRGKIDFLHRMKIEIIKEAMASSTGIFLYADSDSYFSQDPIEFCKRINENTASMHVKEFTFSEIKRGNFYHSDEIEKYAQVIDRLDVTLPASGAFRLSQQMCSWNAGIMIFHESHAKFLRDVFDLTDLTFPTSNCHAAEQFAFSIVLDKNVKLIDCFDMSNHYWYRTHKQVTDLKLIELSNYKSSLAKGELSIIQNFITQLEKDYKNHPIVLYDRAMQQFNFDKYENGIKTSLKYLAKKPFDTAFYRDFLYHIKRKFVK